MFARKSKAGRSASTTRLSLTATKEDDAEERLPVPMPGSRRSSSSTTSAMLGKGSVRRSSTTRLSVVGAPVAMAPPPTTAAPPRPAPVATIQAIAPPISATTDTPPPVPAKAPLPAAPAPVPHRAPPPALQLASTPPEGAAPPPSEPSPPSSWRVLGRRHTMPRLFLDTRLSPIVSSVSPKGSPLSPVNMPGSASAAATEQARTSPQQQHERSVRADAPNPFLSSPTSAAPVVVPPPRRASTLGFVQVPPPGADDHQHHQEWTDWSADLRARELALRDKEQAIARREDALHQREIVAAVHAKGLQRLGMDVSAASAAAAASTLVATPTEMSPRAPAVPAAPTPVRLARIPSPRDPSVGSGARRDSASSAPARPNLLHEAAQKRAGSFSQAPAVSYSQLPSRRSRTSPLPRATSPTQTPTISTATPGATASESEALISTLLSEIDTLTQSLSVAQGEIAQREADYERLERRHADALGAYEGERARWAELEGQRDAVEDELRARVVVLEQMLGFEHKEPVVSGDPGPSEAARPVEDGYHRPERRPSADRPAYQPARRPSADSPAYQPAARLASNEEGYTLDPLVQEHRTVGNWVLDVQDWGGGKGKGKRKEGSSGTDTNAAGGRASIAHVVRRDSFGVGDDEAGPSGDYARGAAEREWEREEAEREA
ncbi:uncharacterized protein LOC62_05G007444 [Vanrija pseudolonga]|uniref:Uncharacterized protein n=1 Tax=Vanrija pseudolonga TaxID=143232 RepID=A0AAF0YFZ7_9TREE|nr:hypothetical protein LOC62_05G007444 [Vanrija pseudolonga]